MKEQVSPFSALYPPNIQGIKMTLDDFVAGAKKKLLNKVTAAICIYAFSAGLAAEGIREYSQGKDIKNLAVYLGMAAIWSYLATNILYSGKKKIKKE